MKWLVTETLSHDGQPEMIAGDYPWAKIEAVPDDAMVVTRQQIESLVEYPTTYANEGEGLFLNVSRFQRLLDELFGKEPES